MKAMLVMDMPSCCEMCDLRCLNYQHGYDFCSASEEVDIDYTNYKVKRNEKCPLKPMPQKRILPKEQVEGTNYGEEPWFSDGYNACIDEILGE